MAAEVGIVIIGTDPDKCFTQRHVAYGAVDPGNILKEIIDVAINDLIARYPSSSISLRRSLSKSLTSSFVIAIASPYAWLT